VPLHCKLRHQLVHTILPVRMYIHSIVILKEVWEGSLCKLFNNIYLNCWL